MAFDIKCGVVSNKGGVGKSTLIREVGGILHKKGYSVSLIEVDDNEPQKMWFQRASFGGSEPPITVLESLEDRDGDILLIDTKGGIDDDVRTNMTICDALFVPVRGDVNDLDATAETVEFLRSFDKPFCTVLSMIADKEKAKSPFSDLLRIKANPLPSIVGFHECLNDYHKQGKLAVQFEEVDDRAKAAVSEIEPLVNQLLKLAGVNGAGNG